MMHSIVNGRKNRRNVERHRARRLTAASHTEWRANAGIVSHGVRFCVSAADSAAVARSRVRRSALSWPYEPRSARQLSSTDIDIDAFNEGLHSKRPT